MASTLKRESCEYCLSSDNVCHWIDEEGKHRSRCTTPDCDYNKMNKNQRDMSIFVPPNMDKSKVAGQPRSFLEGKTMELRTRGLTEETCKRLGYQVGKDEYGEWVRILNWYDEHHNRIAQKIKKTNDPKTGKKRMYFINHNEAVGLYGKWLWSPNDRLFVTVTEGEEDMGSVMQVQGYQYPVVSIPKGCDDAKRSLERDLKWLLGFKYVILAFDNDDCGRKATEQCLPLFEPGRVRVATWPLKDANEMLLAGREREIRDILFNAKEIVPEASVTISDVIDRVLVQPKYGLDFPWKTWTEITYGLQMGEIHIIVASPAVGKTEIIKEMIFHYLDKYDFHIGLFSFEQTPDNTIRRLVGSKLGIKLHLPGQIWEEGKIRDEALKFDNKIFLYDKAGKVKILDLFNCMRYWAKAKNVRLFIVDNIKALGIAGDNEKANEFMNDLKSLMKELNTTCILLSHVSKDKFNYSTYVTTSPKDPDKYNKATAEENGRLVNKSGLEWETGRMPTINNVEGGNIIVALSDYVFGLARDRTNQDETIKRTMRVRALKTRLDSSMDGREFKLYYTDTGQLIEIDSLVGF